LDNFEFKKLRISLDYPCADKTADYIINNTTYGDKLEKIIELCTKKNIQLIGDCIFFPCIFANSDKYNKFTNHVKNLATNCNETMIPFDIKPDLSYQHCYSAGFLGGKNILDFPNYAKAYEQLSNKKLSLLNNRTLPNPCLTCSYYKDKICNSLCLGCSGHNDAFDKHIIL